MTLAPLTLIPVHNRDYPSASLVKADWEAGKDFLISDISSKWNGKPTSIRDGHPAVQIRYSNLRKATLIYGAPK